MKQLIIYILSGLFFLTPQAQAQDTYLNCKWEQGKYATKNKDGGFESIRKKGDYNTADIMLTIDFNKKKIISSPAASVNRGEDNKVYAWDEKNIEWNVEKKQYKVNYIYRLNRISGQLRELYIDQDVDKSNPNIRYESTTYYICEKTQKKF
jgi:hypothetical protein